jgi:hypothetical protein
MSEEIRRAAISLSWDLSRHGKTGALGRGDPRSPGKAPDLHKTALTREQLIEVIACGRPATEMPHFDKYAYEDKSCYGLSAAGVGKNMPPDPHSTPLTRREIEAVADYILATFVGITARSASNVFRRKL